MSNFTTYLLLVRHGENDWVGTDRLAGRTPDVHLNDKGRQQATDLAPLLAKQPIVAIYSSPLERCVETAQPLAAALAQTVIIEPGVLEIDYGEWRGANLKDLSKLPEWTMCATFPQHLSLSRGRNPARSAISGGERAGAHSYRAS